MFVYYRCQAFFKVSKTWGLINLAMLFYDLQVDNLDLEFSKTRTWFDDHISEKTTVTKQH